MSETEERRHRSRSRGRPASAAPEPPVKPRRRWRARTASALISSAPATSSVRRASDPNGTDEPGAGGEGAGWTDGAAERSAAPSDSSEDGNAAPAEDCDGSEHAGRKVISTEVPIGIDQLFDMLFTNSEFFQSFYRKLKYYVTEDQTMLPISKPGKLYVINAEVKNAGVPMADLFYTTKHYCIHRISSKRTKLDAWCQTKFRKSTLLKGFIERTANEGMEEHHNTLEQMLTSWVQSPDRARQEAADDQRGQSTAADTPAPARTPSEAPGAGRGLLLLVLALTLLLICLNGFLYVRLSRLGSQTELLLHAGLLQAGIRPDPGLLDRLTSVQEQNEQHREQLARWQQTVRSAAQLVRQSEATLTQLQGWMDETPEGKLGPEEPPEVPATLSTAAVAENVRHGPPPSSVGVD
ncbi:GRAM domain-containing protein 1B [Amphibalanus amphitrite]|uniref:GRAM domain-containing protein 1B n=1 Tax=Amphibalanus amphitrite TaxID=1232801 RepID=A0A6A4V4P2_AMPAM|nr:GRAM domain-containing protein 1B [Amphibalanus amphitrite]